LIANFLYRNPRILVLTIVAIVVSGVSSLFVMPRLEDPVLGRRVALVSTVFPGANAQRVESLVSIPLEERLNGISDIKQVRSNSQSGISNVVIELQDEVYDVESVWTLVRNRLSDAQANLPESCFQPELHVVPLKAFAAIISVQTTTTTDVEFAELRQMTRLLRAKLVAVSGTERVDTFGDPGEEYLVEIPPTVLASTGLSTAAIAQQIVAHHADQPAGRLRDSSGDLGLQLQSDPVPLKRIADALITYGQGEVKPLAELASVRKTLVEPPGNLAVINGRPAIVLGVMVSDQRRIDQWSDQMTATLDEFTAQYADRVTMDVLFSQRKHVDQRLLSLLQNLGFGTAAVMGVVLLLMGWRSMLVVAAALPLSALMVLPAMRALSIPIHQMSVTGLIVALGLLIDNAIVIVEDVRTRILAGTKPTQAIASGVRHLAIPLFGSTLTTALAFLPIATLPGPPGEFVGTIAVSVILAISASFLLSMTVIPALIGRLRVNPSRGGFLSHGLTIMPLRKLYEFSLKTVYRAPRFGVVLGLALPVAGFLVAGSLPEQFFPASDRAQIQIEVELPARETLAATRKTVASIQKIVARAEEVERQHWFLGSSAPTFFYNVVPRRRGTPFYAQAFVDLRDAKNTASLVRKLQAAIDAEIREGRVIVRQLEQGPPFDAPVEIRVLGPDVATLQELGSSLRRLLGHTSNVIHTRSDLEETISRLSLNVDDIAAQKAGFNRSQIAGLLYTTLEGAPAGAIFDDDEELPVRVRLELEGSLKMERLAALPLPAIRRSPPAATAAIAGPGGMNGPASLSLTLADVTTMEVDADVGAIVRINGQRANEVKAYIQAGVLSSTVVSEFKQRLAETDFALPMGYSLQFGGETEQRSHAVDKLIANGFVLFALILLTLVASFRSFRCAFIVAAVGGLSVGLGPLALWAFGYPFGFMAIVGTMGLVGVAINDSIVVLAAIRTDSAASRGDRQQIVNVVMHSTRHIIATTLTTIVGFVPLIIGGGGFWPPLAITIAGGVGGATFLALYFVPSVYLLLYSRAANDPTNAAGTAAIAVNVSADSVRER
jgi:multidrug efflux pump subunit AcrB